MNRLSARSTGLLCALALLVTTAFTAGPALAAGNQVIKDCQANGQLTGQYTLGQLRHALGILPASVKEYTNCSDVIQQAILAARHGRRGGGSGSGSGGSFLPTPVIVILVVLILAAVTFGAVAIRRRRAARSSDGAGEPGDGPAKTRVMPSTPGRAGDDTARTRVMPSTPDPPGAEHDAETRAMPAEPPDDARPSHDPADDEPDPQS
jgi:hypothetical protein